MNEMIPTFVVTLFFLTMLSSTSVNVWMVNDSTGKNVTRNSRALCAVLFQHMLGRTEKDYDKASVGVTDFRKPGL